MQPLSRAEWIDEFVNLMAETMVPGGDLAHRTLAASLWETAAHRAPANAVQDILIERYLDSGSRSDRTQ